MTLAEFDELLMAHPFTRRIDAVHFHHTWRPNHSQYRGFDTIVSMWRYHTEVKGWSDIAQHLTIAPDGALWTGRSWNQPPCSASGHNGNRLSGPFMIEVIGDFDIGRIALKAISETPPYTSCVSCRPGSNCRLNRSVFITRCRRKPVPAHRSRAAR